MGRVGLGGGFRTYLLVGRRTPFFPLPWTVHHSVCPRERALGTPSLSLAESSNGFACGCCCCLQNWAASCAVICASSLNLSSVAAQAESNKSPTKLRRKPMPLCKPQLLYESRRKSSILSLSFHGSQAKGPCNPENLHQLRY